MARSPDSLEAIETTLAKSGLLSFGCFEYDQKHIGIMIGNAGPAMWQTFSKSKEYQDGKIDPLNRWTKQILSKLADRIGCAIIYPFDKPFPPFQRYAIAVTGVKASPLGLLIHPKYGLWHAFRGVLFIKKSSELAFGLSQEITTKLGDHPCDTCKDKPCLSACPVGAFSLDGLDVSTCFAHLDSDEAPDCMRAGCAARSACPIGQEYKYSSDQLAFHMKSYRGK